MNKYNEFVKERKLIGTGAMSSVYLWNNYAYKCYADNYPLEWIEYEQKVQKEIQKSDLNVPKYYKTNFQRTIKMDYIKGKTLATSFTNENKNRILDDFVEYFKKIHEIKGLKLHKLSDYLLLQTDKAPVTKSQKNKAKRYINEIENNVKEDDVLCHMDYHFLNTIYVDDDVYVIDWINAKNGKAIYDYARTYVLIYEYAAGFKNKYLKKVLSLNNFDKNIFTKAVYVNAINRIEEHDSKRVRKLIEKIEKELV